MSNKVQCRIDYDDSDDDDDGNARGAVNTMRSVRYYYSPPARLCSPWCSGALSCRRRQMTCEVPKRKPVKVQCRGEVSVRSGSFFEGSRLTLPQLMKIIYLWCQNLSCAVIQWETDVASKAQGKERTYAVQIERMPDRRPKGSKGVIKVRPDQSLDYIMDNLRCETATILDAKRLGKSDMLLITFDTEKPPYKIVFDYELVRVYDYRPKHIVCFNCHGLDHIAKHCPEDLVCRDCGRPQHPPDPDCIEDLFCVAYQKPGHISLNSACPSRLIQAPPEATTRNENSKALRIKLEQLATQLSTQSSVSGEIVTEPTSSTTQRKPRSRTRTPRARSSTPKRRPMPKVSMPTNDMSIAQILGILRQERHTESRKRENSFREELTTLTTTFHEQLEAVMTEVRQIIQRDDVKRRKLPTEGK
ncbi:hypothetical protein HPB47_010896 [Ixodes persulcatus]|uniref:Uncharacterized protein n=1 Tax=Ixodes persulcatus TaxID=34615 RepID=A0AC60NXT8_IXOPE|nr:hypothetical protein HPB47_010896 [Ixodes persulcatus]